MAANETPYTCDRCDSPIAASDRSTVVVQGLGAYGRTVPHIDLCLACRGMLDEWIATRPTKAAIKAASKAVEESAIATTPPSGIPAAEGKVSKTHKPA
jgi:hypothetical protein